MPVPTAEWEEGRLVMTAERRKLAKQLHAEGLTDTAIGATLGVSRTTAAKLIQDSDSTALNGQRGILLKSF